MSRKTGGDRGAAADDPRFTSSEAPPRANVPYPDIVPGRDSRPRVSPTAHARVSVGRTASLFTLHAENSQRVSLFLPACVAPRLRSPLTKPSNRPSQTFNMADEGEVSALVCDNGSGMVKVRERPQIWAHPRDV